MFQISLSRISCWMGLQTLMENKPNYIIFWGACNVSKKKKNLALSQCIHPKPASIYVSCTWSAAITGSYYMCRRSFSEKFCAWNFTNSLRFPQITAYKNTPEAAFLAAIKPGEILKESVINWIYSNCIFSELSHCLANKQ